MNRMKFIPLLALSAAILAASCSKKSSSSPSTTTTTTTTGSDWSWSGTAPFSAKVDGVTYLGDSLHTSANTMLGMFNIMSQNSSDTGFSISFVSTPAANTEYAVPSPANFGISVMGVGSFESLKGGKIKVINMTSTMIEGKFYGTLVDPTGAIKDSIKVTEGYFNINY